MSSLNSQVVTATKWSSITEIASKLVAPISTMILARLLTPDAFGVLTTAVMVISFAEIFTDAGFQKYLIQHEFKSSEELYKSTTVAFWSNLMMSLLIWGIIIIFSDPIARIVGNEGYGNVIAVSCICIPLAAFSSIQMALYKRSLDFKTLFWVRIIGVLIPLLVTIPLAFITRSYWALIIGMIAQNFSNAVILTLKSPWKPNSFYDFSLLKEMFSFTAWSMLEAISIWLTGYMDIFIVGAVLDQYYLGIYRTSITTVGQIMGLVTAATTPVLFASLSKLQNDTEAFKKMFFSFQKFVGMLVIPLGVGIFLFRDLITTVLLGEQWKEAAYFIGLWGLSSSVTIVLSHYCSEIFRAKGRPKLSVLAQTIHILFLLPVVLWAVNISFDFLCEMRALVRLTGVIINITILYVILRISFFDMIRNILPYLIGALCMCLFVYYLNPTCGGIHVQMVSVIFSVVIYFAVLFLFPAERRIMLDLKQFLKLS